MTRILLGALCAAALSATALAQSAAPGSVGTDTPSTGQVGSSNTAPGLGVLAPVSPNTTDMDQPAGTSLSGGMNGLTGLDLRGTLSSQPSPLSPGALTPPDGSGLVDLGAPQPSTTDTSGVGGTLSPTNTPGVNR